MKQFDSLVAIRDFRNILNQSEEYGNDSIIMNARIKYKTRSGDFLEEMKVVIPVNGYFLMVKLDPFEDCKIITSDNFHMDFDTKFENTEFFFNKEEEILIIKGNSAKMGGEYQVELKENRHH